MGDDLIRRSAALDEEIAGSSAVHALEQASRRNQRMIWLLAASVAFDIVLSLVLGYETYRTYQLAVQASSIERQAYTTCLAGNDARAGQLQLWGYILSLPPTAPQTPEMQKQRADFQAYVARLYAPRRCVP